MKLRQVTIRNFKAIEDTTLDLADFNVIVGANGSGKSSVLQALHWMLQSATHRQVRPRREGGETISERDALYMPTRQYRNAGHGQEYGNKVGSPQLDLEMKADCGGDKHLKAKTWIKSGRNEGIKVHLPAENELIQKIRAEKREISAYIPGLAGISLEEEKRVPVIVRRQAAAGDANTVLRNILHLMQKRDGGGTDDLERLQSFVSRVMGDLTLKVEFDENRHTHIVAEFQTAEMREADPKRFKPLELAGIGFLQVIQIFAYLIYFRPVLLLVDEPDAHLHPSTQEKLINILAEAAREFDTQVILTTHSPSVVRALPADARVIWMRDGNVDPNGDTTGRQMMGWGLLDKRILLLTEDSKTKYLRLLLSQWPDLERAVAIWPLHGSGKLLDPEGCASLQALFGDSMTIVLHRDRDFMMPNEAQVFADHYSEKGIEVWLTRHSDTEAYWCDARVIAAHFDADAAAAAEWLDAAVQKSKEGNADVECRNSKRHTIRNQPPLKKPAEKGELAHASDHDVVSVYSTHGQQHVILGKTLLSRIREHAQTQGAPESSSFGNKIPQNLANPIAPDLKDFLRPLLA
ncbi:AAA family ATPase [Jhaorihella thermophila]|uniref:Predicted ATPase n=1 Tax=Jhaorihella thermophila TaxID=488547 RepID=A0A1H5ZII5_9RHOB|nr:AAA family ATPase [Jhaorihella thermophila]SEG36333.1 Predicted ATPase [Jhaorihella thermophila]